MLSTVPVDRCRSLHVEVLDAPGYPQPYFLFAVKPGTQCCGSAAGGIQDQDFGGSLENPLKLSPLGLADGRGLRGNGPINGWRNCNGACARANQTRLFFDMQLRPI